jgi:hypothetical protein
MNRNFFTVVIVVLVCVVAFGFYRGWFTLSTHPDAGSKKVDVELTMDREKMEQDAEVLKKKTAELVDKVKEQTTGSAQPSE